MGRYLILAFTTASLGLLVLAYQLAHRQQVALAKRAIVMRYSADIMAEEERSRLARVGQSVSSAFDGSTVKAWWLAYLEAAEIKVKPSMALGYLVLLDLLVWLLVGSWNGGAWISAQIWTLLIIALLMLLSVRTAQRKRERAFEKGLPDFLMLLASSLRAGLSLQRGIDAIASEGDGEVERQLRRASTEMAMGVQPDVALAQVAERMHSQDMQWTVVAIGIQRRVGGNLASILDIVADTVRGRETLKQEVRAVSAEGRMSANVLAALPVGIFLFLFFTRRDYVELFWLTSMGRGLLLILVLLVVTGVVWIRSMVNME